MIEVTDCNNRISIYRHPVIAIKCPGPWVDEAIRFDEWIASEGGSFFHGWNAAKRISKRAFAAYFGLQDQFVNNHNRWSRKRTYTDFYVSDEGNTSRFLIHGIPIKDYKPKVGKQLVTNVWKDRGKDDSPMCHIITQWWCPLVIIVGYVNNDDLKQGKNQITDSQIKPIYEHKILSNIDKKVMYV